MSVKPSSIILGLLAAFICASVILFVARGMRPEPTNEDAAIVVAASFYPPAEFASRVGGGRVRVLNLTPTGIEPHDFEPSPQQVASIYGSDIFVYNGGGIDAWASRLAASVAKNGTKTLELSARVGTLLPELTAAAGAEKEYDNSGRGAFDEHVWLSPRLAESQVVAIRDMLIELDPAGAPSYIMNADAYLAELAALDKAFSDGLASCEKRIAVTSHAAFAYLAQAYDFTMLPITGLSPDAEPAAGELARIADESRKQGVTHIFFETLVSPELARTLAAEIGAQTLVFNPLEGLTAEEISAGKNYLSIMRENLNNLRLAMICK